MAEALEARALEAQQFAAPGLTVAAQTDAVHGQTEYRLDEIEFGADRGNVRVVMLHAERRNPPPLGDLRGKPGAEEIRMQVVGHNHRHNVMHFA